MSNHGPSPDRVGWTAACALRRKEPGDRSRRADVDQEDSRSCWNDRQQRSRGGRGLSAHGITANGVVEKQHYVIDAWIDRGKSPVPHSSTVRAYCFPPPRPHHSGSPRPGMGMMWMFVEPLLQSSDRFDRRGPVRRIQPPQRTRAEPGSDRQPLVRQTPGEEPVAEAVDIEVNIAHDRTDTVRTYGIASPPYESTARAARSGLFFVDNSIRQPYWRTVFMLTPYGRTVG